MKKNTITTLITFFSVISLLYACSDDMGNNMDSNGSGKGGSMARFTISGDFLYTVDQQTLKLFDLSDEQHPTYLRGKDQQLDFGVETISTRDTLLLIGSQDGLYIFNIKRPEFPNFLSKTQHFRSCDPVVASGNYAYVTLNTDNSWCGNGTNVLDIYDITDPGEPILKKTLSLSFPKGLGIDGNKLFVCDKTAGIKVFDISNPINPEWIDDLSYISELQNVETYDVIPLDGLLLVSATGGFYQLDYTGEKIKYVSKIEVKGNNYE